MIKVTIELKSAINRSNNKVLGVLRICNDGTGTPEVGHYRYTISKFDGGAVWKKGSVRDFKRLKKGPHDLLFLVLKDAVARRNEQNNVRLTKNEVRLILCSLLETVPLEDRKASHNKVIDALESKLKELL